MSTLSGGPNIVTNGLIWYLDASNPKSYISGSTTWNDVSKNGNSGALVNGPSYTSSYGGSVVFDGVNDYFLSPNTILPISSSFTLEYAVLITELPTTSPAEYNYIFQNSAGYQTNGIYAEFGPGYYNIITLNSSSIGISISKVPQANIMYYMSATYENRTLIVYENGIRYGTTNLTFDPLNNTTNNFYIGNRGPFFVPFWRFYNRALTPTEVLQNYNAVKGKFGR